MDLILTTVETKYVMMTISKSRKRKKVREISELHIFASGAPWKHRMIDNAVGQGRKHRNRGRTWEASRGRRGYELRLTYLGK